MNLKKNKLISLLTSNDEINETITAIAITEKCVVEQTNDLLNFIISLQSTKPDIAILDISDIDFDNQNIIPIIKHINPIIPLIVLSNKNSSEIEHSLRSAGVFFFGILPMSNTSLKTIMFSALSLCRSEIFSQTL